MREAEIRAMQNGAKNRDMVLFDQLNFLNMRQTAMETVLKVSLLRDRIKWAFNPAAFLAVVDNVQLKMRADSQERAQMKAKAPKLTVVGATGAREVVLSGGNGKDHD